jgi:hypothetical protein
MKKLSPNTIQRLKNVGWLTSYLFLTVIIPILKIESYLSSLHCNISEFEKRNIDMFVLLFLVVMFFSFLPYKLSRFSSRLEKAIFIIIGLLVPLLGLCDALLAKFMCFGF